MRQVRLETVAAGVALVTIDRQDKLNAINRTLVADLGRAITEIEHDAEVRAAVLTGAGTQAFIAGGDVEEMRDLAVPDAERFVYAGQELTLRIERCPVPMVAAVNGFALGGGMEIALACDIRIASETAVFGLPETSLGLLPGWGGSQRAARLLGVGLALEIILTARRVPADEALRIGLVNRVVAPDDLLPTAVGIASAIARNSPVAVRQAKKAIRRGVGLPIEEGLVIEAEAWLYLIAHADRREGLSAFLEKRAPDWRRRG